MGYTIVSGNKPSPVVIDEVNVKANIQMKFDISTVDWISCFRFLDWSITLNEKKPYVHDKILCV